MLSDLPEGLSSSPPRSPWGINFGGGIDSTSVILECLKRGHKPNWILFADTGSERPETIAHVQNMQKYLAKEAQDWPELTVVKWVRKDGSFEALHDNCLRNGTLPSKAYGYAGCTSKWKIYPMDKWRKQNNFQIGAFAVGYNASESRRIKTACQRGDDPNFTAWYPLVAWGITREMCEEIVKSHGFNVKKSSCFMCPNMKTAEWAELQDKHPVLFETAKLIEDRAFANGNYGRGSLGLGVSRVSNIDIKDDILEDRCHHGGCFT